MRSDSESVGGADTGGLRLMGKEYDLSNCFLNSGLQQLKIKRKMSASTKVLAKNVDYYHC